MTSAGFALSSHCVEGLMGREADAEHGIGVARPNALVSF
jgi:hypothetical protein